MVSSLASEAEQKEDSRDHDPAVFSREVFDKLFSLSICGSTCAGCYRED
jgi:hypothetical protein